jgi:ribosomal protein L7/L12
VRDLLIEQHGVDCLQVAREGYKKGVLLKVFREAFDSSISEAKEFSENVTGSGHEATRVETALLAKLLRDRGVDVEVTPGSCA